MKATKITNVNLVANPSLIHIIWRNTSTQFMKATKIKTIHENLIEDNAILSLNKEKNFPIIWIFEFFTYFAHFLIPNIPSFWNRTTFHCSCSNFSDCTRLHTYLDITLWTRTSKYISYHQFSMYWNSKSDMTYIDRYD